MLRKYRPVSYELLRPEEVRARRQKRPIAYIVAGALEWHSFHLPLGTDVIIARYVADEVAKIEPALVFPVVNLSSNFETKAFPGGIVMDNQLLFALFENICDEIGRNGCKKIMFISGHGGNKWFLPQFVMSMLDKGKDWVPYYCDARGVDPDALGGYMNKELFNEIFDSEEYGHACEWEASEMLHIDPESGMISAAGDPATQRHAAGLPN